MGVFKNNRFPWLHWASVAVCGLSRVVAERGLSRLSAWGLAAVAVSCLEHRLWSTGAQQLQGLACQISVPVQDQTRALAVDVRSSNWTAKGNPGYVFTNES